jgi:hypothetical protein
MSWRPGTVDLFMWWRLPSLKTRSLPPSSSTIIPAAELLVIQYNSVQFCHSVTPAWHGRLADQHLHLFPWSACWSFSSSFHRSLQQFVTKKMTPLTLDLSSVHGSHVQFVIVQVCTNPGWLCFVLALSSFGSLSPDQIATQKMPSWLSHQISTF